MLEVEGNRFTSEDWASSQSSVVISSGKQEQQQQRSSSSSSTSNSVLLKEHDYIGMNEVSSSFKAALKNSNPASSHLNLQETELRLGISSTGASFQPKSDSVNSGSEGSSEVNKVLDLGVSKTNLGEGVEKKLPEMANRSLSLAPEKDPGSPFTQMASKPNAKRVFSEAIGGEDSGFPSQISKLSSENPFTQLSKHPLLPPLYPWKMPKQQQQQQFMTPAKSTKVDDGETTKVEAGDPVEDSSTRAPVVGWPPVQSFRKTTLSVPQPSKSPKLPESQKMVAPTSSASASQINSDPASPFVKVYMDGVSIGRKVEIKTDESYDKLVAMLEEMFQYHITGQNSKGENKKPNFLSDSEFVLTYEDKDGDLMLVGDVPWKMFVGTVKRLRIMKGTDAIGLAPRGSSE